MSANQLRLARTSQPVVEVFQCGLSLTSTWCLSFAAVRCPSLEVPGKANVSCSGELGVGAVCTFSCPEGWTLNGSVALTCDTTGHWSGMPPTCEGEALIDGVHLRAREKKGGGVVPNK